MLRIALPYPISVNQLWKRSKTGIYVNPKVQAYKNECFIHLRNLYKFGDAEIAMRIWMIPPDRRQRDIDNILKVIFDTLQYCGIYKNDCQIRTLCAEKLDFCKDNGSVIVEIEHFSGK